jgi:hypothetical protein
LRGALPIPIGGRKLGAKVRDLLLSGPLYSAGCLGLAKHPFPGPRLAALAFDSSCCPQLLGQPAHPFSHGLLTELVLEPKALLHLA